MFTNMPILQQLSPEMREFIVRLVLAFLALVITWLMRRLITAIVIRPFRQRAEKSEGLVDDQVLDVIQQPLQWLILALGIFFASRIMGIDPQQDTFITPLLNTIVIAAVALACYRAVSVLSLSSKRVQDLTGVAIEERLMPFVRVALRLVVIILGVTLILQNWGYNVDTLVAGLGIGSIGVSLAAQDTIGNLFGFASIVTDRPFAVGDTIEIGGDEGVVEHVGLRSTVIRKDDQSRVIIPNGTLAKSTLTNWSRLNKRQIDFSVPLKSGITSEQLQKLTNQLRELLLSRQKIAPTSVAVLVTDFAEGKGKLRVMGYLFIREGMEYMKELDLIHRRAMELVAEYLA
ncbi:MAG: mechanosensitive ion channel family protein [Anaerolineae bacterium]|nr:mechanosensitive ion channel family protein [Anaerolineae bacterium]